MKRREPGPSKLLNRYIRALIHSPLSLTPSSPYAFLLFIARLSVPVPETALACHLDSYSSVNRSNRLSVVVPVQRQARSPC